MACEHDKHEPTDWIEYRRWRCGCVAWRQKADTGVLEQVAEQLLTDSVNCGGAPKDIAKARDLVRRALHADGLDILRLDSPLVTAGEALQ